MKKYLKSTLSIVLAIVMLIAAIPLTGFKGLSDLLPTAKAALNNVDKLPDDIHAYPEQGQKYWVLFNEGLRGNRLELSTFDVISGTQPYIIWNNSMRAYAKEGTVSRSNQFHYEDTEWVYDRQYAILTDKATRVFASNVPVYNNDGKLLLSATKWNDISSNTFDITQNAVGDIIEFGSYPQGEVKDSSLINALNSRASSLKSYGYYSGNGDYGSMVQGDWMKYCDVTYNGAKYRGVYFTKYRPYWTEYGNSSGDSYQDDNGYYTNTYYWFKFEPLKWKVLDPNEGFVLSESLIDSQPYQNLIYSGSNGYYNNPEKTVYANDYVTSSIRKWLNDDFYNTAFTADEKSKIGTTKLDNSAYPGYPEYDSKDTNDKIFLMSYNEIINADYGFSTNKGEDTPRQAKDTDYSKSQGIGGYDSSPYYDNCSWWLRSPGFNSPSGCIVDYDGGMQYMGICSPSTGVRPAFKFNPKSGISESDNPQNKKQFNKSMYVADIWLNNRSGETTTESVAIKDILGYESLSANIYDNLRDNKDFQRSLALWNGLEVAFDPTGSLDKHILSKKDLYEGLILDLLKKVMDEQGKEYSNVILDAVDNAGSAADTVTRYKKSIDQIVNLAGGPTSASLPVLKDWINKTDSDKFFSIYQSVDDVKNKTSVITKNKFYKGIGTIANVASDVNDFYKRLTSYMMAVDMAEEMHILLVEMKNNTSDNYFKLALQDVINSVDNADYVAVISTLNFAQDTAFTVFDKVFDAFAEACPVYNLLRAVCKAGTVVDNILFNTTGAIDAYYLAEVTKEFISANKKSINSLASKYLSDESEFNAAAYVYAMRTYLYVYEIDLDSSVVFMKNASEEGLVNKINNLSNTLVNWIYGTEIPNTYEQFCENTDSIKASLAYNFNYLTNAWIYNESYLKKDYPAVYPVFVAADLSKDMYMPHISSAYINKNGESVVNYYFDGCVYDKNRDTYYPLYGTSVLEGFLLKENINGVVTEEYKNFNSFERSTAKMYNSSLFKTFPKKYSLSAYTTINNQSIYTKEAEKSVSLPCSIPAIGLTRTKDGIRINITDSSSQMYDYIKYHIYRSEEDGGFSEISVINRNTLFGERLKATNTPFLDSKASTGKAYTYKVVSEISFNNGVSLFSSESNQITLKSGHSSSAPVTIRDRRQLLRRSTVPAVLSICGAVNANAADSEYGIELQWQPSDNADGYEIYRLSSYGSVYRKIAVVDSNQTLYSDETAEHGVSYDYMIIPFTSDGKDNKSYDISVKSEGHCESDIVSDDCSHSYDNGRVLYNASCVTDGVLVKTCTLCGATAQEAIPQKGHTPGDWVVTKPAEIGAEGEEARYCQICNEKMQTRKIPALNRPDDPPKPPVTNPDQSVAVLNINTVGEVKQGEYIDVKVTLNNAVGLMNGSFELSFDNSVLQYVSCEKLDIPHSSSAAGLSDNGIFRCSFAYMDSCTDNSLDMFTVRFKVLKTSDTVLSISSDDADFTTNKTVQNKEITLKAVSASVKPSESNPPAPTQPRPDYTVGDVNGDKKVNSADARKALRIALKLESASGIVFLAADVNSDKKVTSQDARIILRVALKLQKFD